MKIQTLIAGLAVAASSLTALAQNIAVKGKTVYTMAGTPIENGVVVVRDGKIADVGREGRVRIPRGFDVLEAEVVTPGFIDAHNVAGLAGIYNGGGQTHDQDQLENSAPIQPQLRAIDAYNAREPLVEYIRSFGITTVHTGHGPGQLISGQTMIVKTVGDTVMDAMMVEEIAVAATLDPGVFGAAPGAPGTRGKAVAMLRAELIKAQEYLAKIEAADDDSPPARDLKMESLGKVLTKDMPLLVTVHRAQDIASAMRLAEEFGFTLWLDMATEAYLLIHEIKAAGVPVFVHPTMYRASGEAENLAFDTAAKLKEAGIEVVLQGGFEGYVPKVRVVLFEAAWAAANGLGFEGAMETITTAPAKLLGIDNRVGSIEEGKDGDLVLFNGDPFEYTTNVMTVIVEGEVVSEKRR